MAGLKRNRVAHEYDRNRRRGALGGAGVDRAGRDDSVDFEADQLLSHFAYLFGLPLRPPVLDCDVSALNVTKVPQALCEGFKRIGKHGRTVPEETDAVELSQLLAACDEWPRRCAAEQRDEIAANHSITASTRSKNASGIVRPMAFAVLRLIASSNLVGCSMGKSLGCLPCKILCTNLAPCRNAAGPSAPNDIRPPISANARGVETIGTRYLIAISVRRLIARLP